MTSSRGSRRTSRRACASDAFRSSRPTWTSSSRATARRSTPSAVGYPLWNIRDLPAGDYYVQAVFNVYTQYHRADGHAIWAHQDHWDGQRWAYSPGNLVSTPVKVHLDPAAGFDVQLTFDHVLPPIDSIPDTKWVKRISIQSDTLTKWWGVPQRLGAIVLLPKGYDEHPNTYYPGPLPAVRTSRSTRRSGSRRTRRRRRAR